MTLEPKDALTQYHFAERLKLDIMMIAHQYLIFAGFRQLEALEPQVIFAVKAYRFGFHKKSP